MSKTGDLASRSERNAALISTLSEAFMDRHKEYTNLRILAAHKFTIAISSTIADAPREALSVEILSNAAQLYEKSRFKSFAIGEWLHINVLYYQRIYLAPFRDIYNVRDFLWP